MPGLSEEDWQIVQRHLSISVSLCFEAGLNEDEIREEFENVLDNERPSDREYVPGKLKPTKP